MFRIPHASLHHSTFQAATYSVEIAMSPLLYFRFSYFFLFFLSILEWGNSKLISHHFLFQQGKVYFIFMLQDILLYWLHVNSICSPYVFHEEAFIAVLIYLALYISSPLRLVWSSTGDVLSSFFMSHRIIWVFLEDLFSGHSFNWGKK